MYGNIYYPLNVEVLRSKSERWRKVNFVNSYLGLYWYIITFVPCRDKNKIWERMNYLLSTIKLESL